MPDFYAHSNGNDKTKWESLIDHLKNVSDKTSEFCDIFGFPELGKNVGFLHDIGKYQKSFQDKINGKSVQVEHSICGAKESFNIFTKPYDILNRQIIAYAIAGHHSGLPDCGTEADIDQNHTLLARLKRKVEDYSAYKQGFAINDIPDWAKDFYYSDVNDKPFAFSILTRMLYSALVDADSLETERFYNNGTPRTITIADYKELKEKHYKKYDDIDLFESDINKKRAEIRKACELAADSGKGLFSLTVPTGGGKTLSSMTFAINHLIKNGHSRIIYIIPYTAIIEQTAKIFKDIFGEAFILEHHSGITFEDSENEETPKFLATENWDAPIILTTNVQFFDSLFSNKRGNCRKLHNIANSVLIFDEAQMLPIYYLKPCLRIIDILTRNFRCSALLMSATCPDFKQYMHSDTRITEINSSFIQHYKEFKRVSADWIGKKTDEEIIDLIDENATTLIIVNSRQHARDLFGKLPDNLNKYHLSTLMTPENRKRVLERIRNDLTDDIPCVVVSTQLIECGVDLDFATVLRSLAGIDSIVQAGGRCNREGKRTNAKVYIFEAVNGDPHKGDIPVYKSISRAICETAQENNDDIFDLKYIQEYFKNLLEYKDKETDAQKILELFKIGRDSNGPLLRFDFSECARRFSYIDDANKKDILISSNDEARNLIAEIKNPSYGTDLRSVYRKLGQYTVSVYLWEYECLRKNYKLEFLPDIDSKAILADSTLYSDELGLIVSSIGEFDPNEYIL